MKLIAGLPRRALKKREAAIILGVSTVTLDKLIREGRLRAFRPTETSLRIMPEDLERFIAENATIPDKPLFATV
jgi:excisionase family DNA binding protein